MKVGSTKNIDSIDLKETPKYELKLVDRKKETNEAEIIKKIEENTTITYKYYEVALEEEIVDKVNTIEEAEELINTIKETNDVELTISEKYTQNVEDVETIEVEVAKVIANEKIEEISKKKSEDARIASMPELNGIKLATIPVTGTITSRYGESSRLRRSTHTGLDIATKIGTPISVIADGIVTFSGYEGSYGNIVKVDHGNGLETWYAHANKVYVTKGQTVKAEQKIAEVGSTGNSTGPHLHFEIRINGNLVNPENYLYK
ncbi:MAG: M23 family metallopeptidase [Clostridia bacterium]|nr:M23 family metallopeptidase [Clostridia bacterium]